MYNKNGLLMIILIILNASIIKLSYLHQPAMIGALLVTIPVSIFTIYNMTKNEKE